MKPAWFLQLKKHLVSNCEPFKKVHGPTQSWHRLSGFVFLEVPSYVNLCAEC